MQQNSNILEILNNPICEIEKMDNQILINQEQITTDDQNLFKKQLNQVIKQIDSQLLQDRQQLLDEYEKLKQEYYLNGQIQNNDTLYFYLVCIKQKYEQILIELSNSELSQFKLDFISPFHLKYDIQSSLFINSKIRLAILTCGSNCNLFYDTIKHLINNKIRQQLIFNTLYIDVNLFNKNRCCKSNDNEENKKFYMNTNINFKELILEQHCHDYGIKKEVYFDFEVKPSVSKLTIISLNGIKLNLVDLETSVLSCALQFLKNIHEQQSEIGEIKIRHTIYTRSSQSIYIIQQLFQCKYLIYLDTQHNENLRYLNEQKNILDQNYKISSICNHDRQKDIYLYNRLYQPNDINVIQQDDKGIFDNNIKDFPTIIEEDFSERKQILEKLGYERFQKWVLMIIYVSKEAHEVVNKRYSISLSCITAYKLFHTYFLYIPFSRILYDLLDV